MADAWEATLNERDRGRVVWVGRKIPVQLSKVVKVLGLTAESVRDVRRVKANSQDLFAVLVSGIGADLDKAVGRLLRLAKNLHVQDHGVLLGVVSHDVAKIITLRSFVEKSAPNQIAALDLTPDALARGLRRHRPGPPANPDLQIEGHGKTYDEYDYEADRILLQRAFEPFTRIILTEQPGGFSQGCKVWRIDANRDSDLYEPFVAKAAPRSALEEEFSTYCAWVRDTIPFPFRAPILETQFVKGETRAILVSAFVSRSQRLDEYLAAASSPELVVVSIFQGALGNWRRFPTRVDVSLGHFYIDQQRTSAAKATRPDNAPDALLGDPVRLTPAYEFARTTNQNLPDPQQVWTALDKLPVKERFVCRAHGDLNVRNVFVRWNAMDTILIDFAKSGIRESLARDPSKLETSISLTSRDLENAFLPTEIMTQIYQPPLLPPRSFPTVDARTEAIRQIRRQVGGEGVQSDEYEILTICHLLRFACVPAGNMKDESGMQQRRALSYALACRLLANLATPISQSGR